jgi:hypothetical protein
LRSGLFVDRKFEGGFIRIIIESFLNLNTLSASRLALELVLALEL